MMMFPIVLEAGCGTQKSRIRRAGESASTILHSNSPEMVLEFSHSGSLNSSSLNVDFFAVFNVSAISGTISNVALSTGC